MGFHRTVMRNCARRIAGGNGAEFATVWDHVIGLNWQARGCLAVVRVGHHRIVENSRRRVNVRAVPTLTEPRRGGRLAALRQALAGLVFERGLMFGKTAKYMDRAQARGN